MAKVNTKDVPEKQNQLGQFFTPEATADFCLDRTAVTTPIVIEPSCGQGVFLDKIRRRFPGVEILGVELDEAAAAAYAGPERVELANFYDFDLLVGSELTFIGNPPYRTPACSLGDDPALNRRDYVRRLCAKYGITGIREEAVFFLVHSIDLMVRNDVKGHIYYILPKTIFRNNSRSYKTFTTFLRENARLVEVTDIGKEFSGVTTDLCYVHLAVDGTNSDVFTWNGAEARVDSFYGVDEDIIPFQAIFKKTYLGSVPCESVLMSCRDEPVGHFGHRMRTLFHAGAKNVYDLLCYKGVPHLKALQQGSKKKLAVVEQYVEEIRTLVPKEDFLNGDFYRPITHRSEERYYFRHEALKKASFVYQLNPKPGPGFYFPGNPAKGCND